MKRMVLNIIAMGLMVLLAFVIACYALFHVERSAYASGVTDPTLILNPAPLPLQPVGTLFVDPVFDTTLLRVSNTSDSGGFETQIYSQLQAFSPDNAYLLLDSSDGFVVRRVSDLSLLDGLDTTEWNAPRWHPSLAHTLVHFDTNADTVVVLQFTDAETLTTTTAFTFPAEYERVRVNQSFDELSHDGRWLAGMVTRNDGADVVFALDIQNNRLGAQLPLHDLYAGSCEPDPEWGEVEPDWVGVSPLGNYLVVQWQRDGTNRCSGLETFDLQTGAFIGRVYDGHQHGDLGVQPDGVTEFFMTFELYHPSGNEAIGVRELPGTSTVSPPTYVQVMDWIGDHISCQGPHGVCLVTTVGNSVDGWSALEGELFLQYTDGSVLRLVHHRSSGCGYWVQPRASISRDGRYAVFASDWGQETGTDSCDGGNDLGLGDPYILNLETELNITTTSLPDGTVGEFYNQTLNATGGASPYAWSILDGNLPDGLGLVRDTGVISGTPATEGSYDFTVMVMDSASPPITDTQALSIDINPAGVFNITTTSLPDGLVGASYHQTVSATGGIQPYTWSISVGSLPGGLELSGNTGVISGTPSSEGTYDFTLQVADSDSPTRTDTQDLSINIRGKFIVSPARGTIGTQLIMTGQGFGNRKPKVTIGDETVGYKKCKAMKPWNDTEVICLFKKPLPRGTYDVVIKPKGGDPIVEDNVFTVMAPDIGTVVPATGSAKDMLTINGRYFGTMRGSVRIRDENGTEKKGKAKRADWTMDSIRFVVPRGISGSCDIAVTNKIGSDTLEDALNVQ